MTIHLDDIAAARFHVVAEVQVALIAAGTTTAFGDLDDEVFT